MTQDEKKKLSSLRLRWGFVFAAAWIVFWQSVADDSFFMGLLSILMVVVGSPFAFVASHYFAKYQIAQQHHAQQQREELNARAAAAADEAEKARRTAAALQADRLTRIKNARKEIIEKLGVVSDYFDLLPGTTDADRSMLITQNIKNALRELVAKYPTHDLAALIRGDEAIQLQLQTLLPRLGTYGIESDGINIIREARHRALTARAHPV